MAEKEVSRRLTVFLLKEDIEKVEDAVAMSVSTDDITDISIGNKKFGRIVTYQAQSEAPGWLKYFSPIDQIADLNLRTKHASAALFVETSKRLFVLTFGYGRSLINLDTIERNFGLKVVLNTVPPASIRSIDKTEFEQNEIHSRDQASQATDIGDFGIDVDRDILRAVSGIPEDKYKKALGRNISGSDSFCCVSKQPIEKLKPLLQEILLAYEQKDYKKNYPWVDNIIAIKDKLLIANLDSAMVELIRAASTQNIWMAVPEIIDWDEIEGFSYKVSSDQNLKDDVSLENFLDIHPNATLSLDKLKNTKIFALRGQDSSIYRKWSAYACLHAELTIDGTIYILSSGSWYEINKSFSKEVTAFLNDLEYNEIILPKWEKDLYEGGYNNHVAKDKKYALMDKKGIKAAGAKSVIEFCDLATTDKDLIHVKRYGQSAVLSHLFMQGTVSAELFVSDKVFREDVRNNLPASHKQISPDEAPEASEYRITYAIGSSQFGKLRLPFFSQVSLRQAVRFLKDTLKFRINLTKIDIVP